MNWKSVQDGAVNFLTKKLANDVAADFSIASIPRSKRERDKDNTN